MHFNKRKLTFVAAFMLSGIDMARTQSVAGKLQSLVETSAQRLTIAEQVALAKWDSGSAVEDVPREAQVIHRRGQSGRIAGAG
jgi:chorismate mutase